MAQIVPTKGNLLSTKKSLSLAKVGFELLDRKRNILIREMMGLIERANAIQGKLTTPMRRLIWHCKKPISPWVSAANWHRPFRRKTISM